MTAEERLASAMAEAQAGIDTEAAERVLGRMSRDTGFLVELARAGRLGEEQQQEVRFLIRDLAEASGATVTLDGAA